MITNLMFLGRIHNAEEAFRSIDLIIKRGIKNFSIDLMYGIPGQTMDSWKASLRNAVELSPTHISTYELTLEENTPLYAIIKSDAIAMPDEDLILEMYNHTIDYLAGHGYEHYEISNFALPGFKCIHNLNYWNRGEYIGAGAGAHSFVNGVRTKNIADVNKYIDSLNSGIIHETESLMITPGGIAERNYFSRPQKNGRNKRKEHSLINDRMIEKRLKSSLMHQEN